MEYMIGMHPFETFDKSIVDSYGQEPTCMLGRSILGRAKEFIAVESVDSSKREEFPDDEDKEFMLMQSAHSGKFALMYKGEFVTDFIFDETLRLSGDLFAVRQGSNWGAIHTSGEIMLPFEFEDFVRIDDYLAFAKFRGAYGVLDLTRTILH